MNSTYDYIIVGGGTAGVAIASRLKQYLPKARIALLEAGPNAIDHPKVNDVSNYTAWLTLMPEGLVANYSTIPQEHLNDRKIINAAGRLLSGSSAINFGNWMRPSIADCDLIAERAGSNKFLFKNLVTYFRRLETHFDLDANKEFYGFDGPLHTIGGRKYPLRELLKESAKELGHHYNQNATKGEPIGLSDFVQCFKADSESTAIRQHSARVYDLSNVSVHCDSPVGRILFTSARATGVQLLSGTTMHASKEVIISCGTQRTPQLLMLSGIGPHSELSKHSIPLVLDAPAVGQNLNDHSHVMQFFKLKDTSKGFARPWTNTLRPEYTQGLPVDFTLFGHLAASELLPHLRADGHGTSSPSTQMLTHDKRTHFMSVTFYDSLLAPPPFFPSISHDKGEYISMGAMHMSPLSRGSITLSSNDPADYPICDPKFMSTHTDRFILRRAIRENLNILSTAPLADEIEGEIPPLGFKALHKESTDEEIDERVRAHMGTVSHPMGTCALGTVLDGEFRVKGIEGLRVCDASVFPEPVGAMPSCAVYALAELCADMVAGRV
jgi:choline dehydrogenase-like flavoprotein